jgi:hypothetical protein
MKHFGISFSSLFRIFLVLSSLSRSCTNKSFAREPEMKLGPLEDHYLYISSFISPICASHFSSLFYETELRQNGPFEICENSGLSDWDGLCFSSINNNATSCHHAINDAKDASVRSSASPQSKNASAKEQCLCQFPSLRYVHTNVRTCTYFHHQIRHTCAFGNHNCLHQSQGLFLLSQLESLMPTTYHHYTTTITNKLYATLLLVSSDCYITCTSHHHPRYEDQNRKA